METYGVHLKEHANLDFLIWASLCMLFEVDPIYLHYMTDR